MTLLELSAEYQASADLLRNRLRALRRQLRQAADPGGVLCPAAAHFTAHRASASDQRTDGTDKAIL